ncbi:MAG TPA: hypothetical protein VEJ84_18620 [Acidimicrobiales bacterium]|nr:hypothetical protein [Acidimicrobiales bacterium]
MISLEPVCAHRAKAVALVVAGTLTVVTGATGCGGPSGGSPSSALFGTPRQQQCTAIADVLSDGPDPTADPVGYAEAQVLPLRQLKITYPDLRRAVTALAGAYAAYAASSGPAATVDAHRVAAAEKAMNALCPGAAP